MSTLYGFLTSLCKERDMKIEDLQKRLGVSRTTLYRYMKGINQITPELAKDFIEALNMDVQESLEFSKFVSLSAYDQTLIESRYVLDDFLFGKQQKPKTAVDIDMVFYNNDKYLRTLREILAYIYSFAGKDALEGRVKIINCLHENVFIQLAAFLEKVFSEGLAIDAEHFVELSENSYLQNVYSFINIFPLVKHERYKLYYREKEMDADAPANDSVLVSLTFKENGELMSRYFSLSFYDEGMPECIAFDDVYMYSFLSKGYENLKRSFMNAQKIYDSYDIADDISTEMSKQNSNYLIKPNPCYDKIPIEVYESLFGRMNSEELMRFLSALYGKRFDTDTTGHALENIMKYLKRRLEYTRANVHTDVYSRQGLLEFAQKGKLTDHLMYLPAFNQHEMHTILEYIRRRNEDPGDSYKLYIAENELPNKDMIFVASKDYGILMEYVYPEHKEGLLKMLLIKSKRLASIFCDYIENHIPVNQAMEKEEADSFLRDLIENL